ncbi:hypothetical protein K458DRAFT_463761 [Lentithecium fluviatile CBS 122367]|uniref:RING-type domain-containing protein n=1 Tax=Lentithecium fluviatile CBS 122367 TaxID=1168545 RepID=A0A6G1IJ45_9PLEO|nr:hypothetical protein K458DRAFT_463761 [Lentithecium fluviatile CBS 122367]
MIYDDRHAFWSLGIEHVTPSPYAVSADCQICLKPLSMLASQSKDLPEMTKSAKESPFRGPACISLASRGIIADDVPGGYAPFSEDLANQNSPPPSPPETKVFANGSNSSVKLSPFHHAVRIYACGHVHGTECLAAWLEVGCTCPTQGCNRMLFMPPVEQPVTQGEIDWVVRAMGPYLRYRIGNVPGAGEIVATVTDRWIAKHVSENMAETTRKNQLAAELIARDREREDERRRVEREEFMMRDEDFYDDEEEYMEEEYVKDEEEDIDGVFEFEAEREVPDDERED